MCVLFPLQAAIHTVLQARVSRLKAYRKESANQWELVQVVARMLLPVTMRALLVENYVHRELRLTGAQPPPTPQNSEEVYPCDTVGVAMFLLRQASTMNGTELHSREKTVSKRFYGWCSATQHMKRNKYDPLQGECEREKQIACHIPSHSTFNRCLSCKARVLPKICGSHVSHMPIWLLAQCRCFIVGRQGEHSTDQGGEPTKHHRSQWPWLPAAVGDIGGQCMIAAPGMWRTISWSVRITGFQIIGVIMCHHCHRFQ